MANQVIGVIGGSGLYEMEGLANIERVRVDTPFGDPSDEYVTGVLNGVNMVFLPRHGRGHRLLPSEVNYRANIYGMKKLGVERIISVSAVGSLKEAIVPGHIVIPDQFIDRTRHRIDTFFGEGVVVHVAFADPYCPHGRETVAAEASSAGWSMRRDGTLVVVNGPRFSSRAESRWHADAGWTVVGMTGMPEAAIARELALCYTSLCLVTDHDAGVEGGDAVTHAEVLEVFARNVERLKALVADVVGALPADEADCVCRHSVDGLPLPFVLP